MIDICCDFCQRPLPTDTVEDIECYVIFRTKEFKTSDIFPHLCESCATKIDMVLKKYKDSVTKEQLLAEQFAKLNNERRSKLNSSG